MDILQTLFWEAFREYNPLNISEIYKNETTNIRPKILGSRYMSKKVYSLIRNKLHTKIERDYIYDNTRVSLEIYCQNKSFPLNLFYNLLNYYIFVLNRLNHKSAVKIIIYLTNTKKVFPASYEYNLNEDNVNSGVTIFNKNERMIVLYRKEEIFKVLLHELLHYYDIDFHYYPNSYDKYFITKYGIRVKQPSKNRHNSLALFEAYTDTISCYMNIMVNILFKNPNINLEDMQKILENNFENEFKHYMIQASKVCKYLEISNEYDVIKQKRNIYEDSHCFSYYILKACVFYNFSLFIDLINKIGICVDTDEKIIKVLEFFKTILDKNDFWEDMKKVRVNKLILSSLKMTKIKW
jgi:hypothetical protein